MLRPNFIFNSRPSVPVGTQFAFIYALMLVGSDSTCILDRSQKDRQLNGQGLFSEDGGQKMPIQIPIGHSLKYWAFPGIAAAFFAVTVSALAFGLSDEDYLYLATQKVERDGALIRGLSPKEQARLHSLINDPRTINDAAMRDRNVNAALAEFLSHQLWEQSHPGQLWDEPKRQPL